MSEGLCNTPTSRGTPCKMPAGSCPHHEPNRGPGRPSDYTPAACQTVIRLGKQGASRAEWAAELDVSFRTMLNWEDRYPEFLQATTRARQLSQSWWEKQGRKGIWSRDFNASAYRLQVMNRFPEGWRDKQEVEHSGSIDLSDVPDNELQKRAAQLTNRVASFLPSTNGDGD